MSVQAGIWNFDGQPVDSGLLADLSDAVKQQGPDGDFRYIDKSIALLYRPFHTVAESRNEKQPYRSRRGYVLTWDGRLDNRNELIADFRSHLDADPSDVAIVAAAFEEMESDCFRRLHGDWAVTIWKPEERQLVWATDYMAIRHIFYYLKGDRLWWATDLTPLVLLSGDKFRIEDDYIAGYFAHDPEAHLTPYCAIREVPRGHFVRVCNARASVQSYWQFNSKSRIRYKTDAEYEEHFRYIFRQSVRRRLRCDSPILAELSGGLDSSSIVCMADDILAKEGAQTPRVDTLSYYDRSEPQGDDWHYFQKIENERGRIGTHIDLSELGSSPASLEYSEFTALPGCLGSGQQIWAKRADVVRNNGYRAVLSGIGGDEFLGGIPNPRPQLADLMLQFKFASLAKQLIAWSLVKRQPWIQLLGQATMELLPAYLAQHLARQANVESWIDRDFARRTRLAIRMLRVEKNFGLWLPTRRACLGTVLLMANKMAKWLPPVLAHEESRYPYLDEHLIEFILSIPASQLLRPGERRSLMRRSLAGIVPQEILARRTKQLSQRTPVVAMKKQLEQLHTAFDSSLSSCLGYVDHARFLEKLHAASNGEEIHITRMLRTISLELWLRDLASRRLIDTARPSLSATASVSVEVSV